jgi:hypothetical protein
MIKDRLFLASLLLALAAHSVQGQQLYSSQPQPYNIPPGRTIDEYKRQLEDDIYAVERKAELVAQRECISGKEFFYFCSLELNIMDFLVCLYNPALIAGSDAFIRGIKFPSTAFASTPSVAVGIAGIGTVVFGDVKVVSKDVSPSGFNIAITGGLPAYPYSLTVVWIACPANYPLSKSVRDFIPKTVPPPPPYFPLINPASSSNYDQNQVSSALREISNNVEKQSTYNQNQSPYEEYDESSQTVDGEPSSSGTPSENPPPYIQKPERYGQIASSDAQATPFNGRAPQRYTSG